MLMFLVGCQQQAQIPNPASKFCTDKGFKLTIKTDKEGSQSGYCAVEGETTIECEEWDYFRGECPSCNEYCESMPHIQCVGKWDITGKYPDCRCKFSCEEGSPV